jgi:hypothetical protein
MKKLFSLSDDFDSKETFNHFTHYDYLEQLIENGQPSAFKDHLEKIKNESLLKFLKINENTPALYVNLLNDEILKRMT